MSERDETQSIQIAVGTKNKAKLEAVEYAFRKLYKSVETVGFEVSSGISEQPVTDEESIQGAINRAQSAMAKLATANYGVGLEGNVVTISGKMFLHGWVAIINSEQTVGLGHSSGMELPSSMQKAIDGGAELGPLLQEMLDDKDNEIRQTIGTNGVLSNQLYTRVDEFKDATIVALAKFAQPKFYK